MGFIYNDYTAISFTNTETNYWIGTDAGDEFMSESTLLHASEDCLVRFNGAAAVQHFIPRDVYFNYTNKIVRIFVVRDTVNGTLRVWSEGNIKT